MKSRASLPPIRRGTIAFTLVEVLVAEAIFLILLVLVVQLIFASFPPRARRRSGWMRSVTRGNRSIA